MAYNHGTGGHYTNAMFPQQQQRHPSPSARPAAHYDNPSLQQRNNLLQQLDNFIRRLSDEPSAIPEEQHRLNVLVPALQHDTQACTDICQHLWQCCLNNNNSVQNYNNNAASGDRNSSSLPSLSTYDFARICSVLVAATSTASSLNPTFISSSNDSPFFHALLKLCSATFDEHVKPFLDRHDSPSRVSFAKDRLKLVLQANADLVSQLDSLQLLKSSMRVIVSACISIIHVDDRRRDPPALSEELLFTAVTSVLRVAGPKIDDVTIVAHLIKDYPQVVAGLLHDWEEIFMQLRLILTDSSAAPQHQYSTRVKNQMLALLEARAGYWGTLSSQYAAMQACAMAFVAGDAQAIGAACADYYTTFGNGLAASATATTQPEQLGGNNVYAEQQNYATRPSTLMHQQPEGQQQQASEVDEAELNASYLQFLSQSGQQTLLAEMIDGVPEDELEAEHAKFASGEGVYSGGGGGQPNYQQQQQVYYGGGGDDLAAGMNNIVLSNGETTTRNGGGNVSGDRHVNQHG